MHCGKVFDKISVTAEHACIPVTTTTIAASCAWIKTTACCTRFCNTFADTDGQNQCFEKVRSTRRHACTLVTVNRTEMKHGC